jgi:nucleotide-binding universal stress UspA family protein
MQIERILVPVDFSEDAREAVDHAIEFAQSFGSEIHLLHSYQINPGGLMPYGPSLPVDFYDGLRAGAGEELAKVRDRVVEAGLTCEMHLSQDIPSSAIVSAAKELSADLIVMGTRGLSGLKHVLLGSVAERTVRFAPCPVLTVGPRGTPDH